MAFSTRASRSRSFGGVVMAAVGCLIFSLGRSAFTSFPAATSEHRAVSLGVSPSLRASAHVVAQEAVANRVGAACGLMGAAVGVVVSVGLVASGARRLGARSLVAARVAPGVPSLIQVLEQKKLLSTVEKLKLLSQAERLGLGLATVEQLGVLGLAEEYGLLTLAESVLTNPATPIQLLAAAGALGGLTYLDVTAADFGFLQWFLAGALGAPALVLAGAAFVIFSFVGGARRSRNLDQVDREVVYDSTKGDFKTKVIKESVSLIDVLEKKKLLSFVENNRLLTLAASLVKNPLTLTENLGVLSQLEKTGLLSQVESSATDTFGAASYAATGTVFLVLAVLLVLFVPGTTGVVLAALAALPGLALIAVSVAFGLVQAPKRFGR